MEKDLIKQLQACNNVADMLKILHNTYDLSQPLGLTQKASVVFGLQSAVKLVRAPLLKKK